MKANTPESIKPHAQDYSGRAWENYGFDELGNWIHLLAKRATHRTDERKMAKDLYDAQNYLNMMQAKLDGLYPHIERLNK